MPVNSGTLFKQRSAARTRRSRLQQSNRRRWGSGIERLEDRTLLAAFTVNSLADTIDANPGDGVAQDAAGQTTLRAAIMEANARAGDDSITLPAGTYTLSLAGTNEDGAATGDLDVTSNGRLTITGAGAGSAIIDAATLDRVLHVLLGANLSISGLTIRNGKGVQSGANPPGSGGGIFNSGTLVINNTIVSGNSTDAGGGGILNSAGAVLTISDSTIVGNRANFFGSGAGIGNSGSLTIINTSISDNSAGNLGGGLYNFQGMVTIVSSTIRGNSAAGANFYGQGGGIYNLGTLTMTSSTVSRNSATDSPSFPSSIGGGIYSQSGTVTITNSTISSNSARSGGGIHNNGDMTIRSTTIAGNSSSSHRPGFGAGPAGIGNSMSGTLSIQNSIIAKNAVLSLPGGPSDYAGTVNSHGSNLIGNSLASSGWIASDLQNVDPRFGPFGDNGGPTMTYALLPDSPAIDAGNNTGAPSTDQRGNRRPRDGNGDGIAVVDIGAFEVSLDQSRIEAVHDTATVNEDTTANTINVLVNDTGPTGTTLTVAAVTQPAHGTAEIGAGGLNVLYTPRPNFAGTDTFAYTVSDGSGGAATAMVTITVPNVDTDWQGTAGDDVFLVRRGPGFNIQVFTNSSASGTPIFSMPPGSVNFLAFETLGGDDRLIVDLVLGSPIPDSGIQYLGGANGNLGDQLIIRDTGTMSGSYAANATSAGNGVVIIGGRNIALTGVEPIDVSGLNSFTVITPNAADMLSITSTAAGMTQLTATSGAVSLSPVTFSNVSTFIIDAATKDAGVGNDSLTVSASGVVPAGVGFLQFRSGTGANTLTVQSGTARIDSTVAPAATLDTNVADGAQIVTHRFRQTSLTLGNGSRASVVPDGTNFGTSVLNNLSIAATAALDLADNDLVLKPTAANKPALLSTLYDRLKSGYAGGAWIGSGLISSAAQSNPDTTLALVDNAVLGLTHFSGELVDANSLLLKYTYYGDIDQNGAVDADDLTVFANNFGRTSGATQVDGDIDFNGTVDADDLTVFANNFGKGAGVPLAASPSVVISLPVESLWVERREMEHASSRGARRLHSSFPSSAWERSTAKLRFANTDELASVLVAQPEQIQPRRAELENQSETPDAAALVDLVAHAITENMATSSGSSLADSRLAGSRRMPIADAI